MICRVPEGLTKHFRRQAASSHAEQNRVAKTGAADLMAKFFYISLFFYHPLDRIKPAQTVLNLLLMLRVAFPKRRIFLPNAFEYPFFFKLFRRNINGCLKSAQ